MEKQLGYLADKIMELHNLKSANINSFADINKLISDIYEFCNQCYEDKNKLKEEYFISSYYSAICLTILYKKIPNAFTPDNAYDILKSQFDVEYCDVYSDILFGYENQGSESYEIWSIFLPYLKILLEAMGAGNNSEEIIVNGMKNALYMGSAVANTYYYEEDDEDYMDLSDIIYDVEVDEEALIGRNFHHYVNGNIDKTEKFSLDFEKIIRSELEYDKDNYDIEGISEYISNDCWIKKINIPEEPETNFILVLEINDKGCLDGVDEITVFAETVSNTGSDLFHIPEIETDRNVYYQLLDYIPMEAGMELKMLSENKWLGNYFSFIGKPMPQVLLDECDDDEDGLIYTLTLQSAYRSAYMVMNVYADEEGIIEDFDYLTYKSTGSGYMDMFTRPEMIENNYYEIADMLIEFFDKYDEDELEEFGV